MVPRPSPCPFSVGSCAAATLEASMGLGLRRSGKSERVNTRFTLPSIHPLIDIVSTPVGNEHRDQRPVGLDITHAWRRR